MLQQESSETTRVRQRQEPCDAPSSAQTAWEDLTERVRAAGLTHPSPFADSPAYQAFFEQVIRGLHRTLPRHVLVLRERGVGEQAVLIELVRRSLEGSPAFLRQMRFGMADFRRLPAEAARAAIEQVVLEATADPRLVLCIDGLANLLRPYAGLDNRARITSILAGAAGRIIGLLSPREFEELIAFDADALELFTVVRLHEPDVPTATALAAHYAAGLAMQYDARISDGAIARSVALTSAYVLHERLPAKAVNVLRSICDDIDFDRSQHGADRREINEDDVTAKVASLSGVPAETLTGVGSQTDYATVLGSNVVGQNHAVREVATELALIKAGLSEPGKPATVLMFIGQTGTGKTELAKAIARLYSASKRLKTFTLGNFSEPHSVSGLIGVPPGYVGHDQGGRLVNELLADPYGVFLLDEADKAHPDVMQPFLNLFDEGWIYDQRGVRAQADRAIFILTTNVGQRQVADLFKQGKSVAEVTWTMKESLARIRHTKSNRPVFTPEFLARVRRLIVFRSLDCGAMLGIAQKMVDEIRAEWRASRQRELIVADALVEAVAAHAHALDQKSQGKEGGRVVRRVLRDVLESPIQAAIAQTPQEYLACRRVEVTYDPPPPPAPAAAEESPPTEAASASGPPPAGPNPADVRVRFLAEASA
jgi:ATP-dependent Clp protease ATP-binding subunit ClpA